MEEVTRVILIADAPPHPEPKGTKLKAHHVTLATDYREQVGEITHKGGETEERRKTESRGRETCERRERREKDEIIKCIIGRTTSKEGNTSVLLLHE
jgi:hypothetical protein